MIGIYVFSTMFTESQEWKTDELNRIEQELESITTVDLLIDKSHKDLLGDGEPVRTVAFYHEGSLYEGRLAVQDGEISLLIPAELGSSEFVPYDEGVLNSY